MGAKQLHKQSRVIESKQIEASGDEASKGKRYDCVLIQEGMGNFGSAYYYTRECLESAVSVFEGKQAYINHPSKTEEVDLPERSVRDLCGHYENVRVDEDDDGRAVLRADIVLLEGAEFDWVRSLFNHGIDYASKYPDEVFVGLSINASGDAEPIGIDEMLASKDVPEVCKKKLNDAKSLGVTEVKLTKQIYEATSVDCVTQPGAGGRIISRLESERTKAMKTKQKQADAPHADEEQDIKLIKSMLDKYMGDGKHGEEEAHECKQAIEAYEAMGEKHEDAIEAAAKHIAAKHKMSAKQAEAKAKEDEAKKKEGLPGMDDSKDKDGDKDAKLKDKKEDEAKEDEAKEDESEKKESIAKLSGQVAALMRENAEMKLKAHIGKKMSEAKLSRKDGESLGKLLEGVKDIATADKLIAAFLEGAKGKTVESIYESNEAYVFHESNKQTDEVSFADCIVKQ